jgi:hypothetical protein
MGGKNRMFFVNNSLSVVRVTPFAQSPHRALDAGPSPESTAGLLQKVGVSISSAARGRINFQVTTYAPVAQQNESGWLRTRRSQVQVLPGAPFAAVRSTFPM